MREGNRERLQAYEGVVIAKRNPWFELIVHGAEDFSWVGVERSFQTHSPQIDTISVKRRGDVRKAELYYLRERSGRSARIKEKLN